MVYATLADTRKELLEKNIHHCEQIKNDSAGAVIFDSSDTGMR